MSKNITFTVRENNALYRLPLGNTIIHFIESDFTYFREQCIEVANQYKSSGAYAPEKASILKEYIRGCHPYCNVLISTVFDKVVIDCIIDYLCVSEGIGLEELWVKKLSATDKFGHAVFHRISEYKTGHAINQWTNLSRMQMYAASKTEFLFNGEEVSSTEYAARKLYFDMAFMLSAQELGCDVRELPQVRRYSAPLLPSSASMLKNAVNAINPVIKSMSGGRKFKLPIKGRECLHDQAAGMAAKSIMNLQRPMLPEIRQLIKTYENLPSEVYEPSCFKAIIDLEFDKLLEFGFFLQKSPETGSYTVAIQSGIVPSPEMLEVYELETVEYTPAIVEKIPSIQEETPAVQEEVPAPVVEIPAVQEEAPAPVEEIPAPAEEVPVAQEETPSPVVEIPVVQEAIPSPVVEIPVAQEEAPAPVVEISAVQEEKPVPVDVIPVVQGEKPAPRKVIPSIKVKMPIPEKVIPSIQEEFSAPEDAIPSINIELPAPDKVIPPIPDDFPAPRKVIPSIKVAMPISEKVVPSIQEEISVPENVIPSMQAEISAPENMTPSTQEESPASEETISATASAGIERVNMIRKMAEDPDRVLSKERTLKEINTRCNLIWNDMHTRIGWDMTEEENREWFKQLIDIRCCMGSGKMMPEDLDKFLDVTEEIYEITTESRV